LTGATLPFNIISKMSSYASAADFWSERYIRHINYMFYIVIEKVIMNDVIA